MTLLSPHSGEGDPAAHSRSERMAIIGASVAVTVALAGLALFLGSWAFDFRRTIQHDRRLAGLRAAAPTMEVVIQAFADEGTRLIAAPASPAELQSVALERAGTRAPEVVAKGERWPRTRVFLTADMVYFIYFDAGGVMRDFTYVSR